MIQSTMGIRDIIQAELTRRKWSKYELAKTVKEQGVSPDTVYKFLAGSRHISDKSLEPILEALGLEVRRKRT